ncbi:hypothetical protein FLGE108171_15370 [Flavobacterium gelidilacus]|uniref:hypothetical protein n=1 Tax=Flavobacterium gelidilacus TaxID=206041 RepID=UPI0004228BB9|nr:hypothetical protein [Flavobacterium gelidilacus]
MNIQDELQKIHHQFGTSEKANYEIQKLFDKQKKQSDLLTIAFSGMLIEMPNNKLESKTIKEHYSDFKTYLDTRSNQADA